MRILFALPGLHRVARGAEIAFTAVATELAGRGHAVTLIGTGEPLANTPYRFLSAPAVRRERLEWLPAIPPFRNETAWEEASFIPGFLRVYRPQDYDVSLTCAYPFLNWALRSRTYQGRRPYHVFVTQNGDWPARATNSEYRWFGCDGLVCINPDYFENNKARYRVVLIPNGVDALRFTPGPPSPQQFGLPSNVPLILMVSAFIASKKVDVGIEAVSRVEGAHLVVAGDGPFREEMGAFADRVMPGRYHQLTVTPAQMPDLYRSASAFLHLSRDESFGNVYVEAMACGVPTIAWNLPRTRWITGDTARLVPDGDVEALVAAIRTVSPSPEARADLTARAGRFAWSKIACQYEDFLDQLVTVEQRKSGGR